MLIVENPARLVDGDGEQQFVLAARKVVEQLPLAGSGDRADVVERDLTGLTTPKMSRGTLDDALSGREPLRSDRHMPTVTQFWTGKPSTTPLTAITPHFLDLWVQKIGPTVGT